MFDRGLDGPARAIKWVYKAQVLIVYDEIGPDADDDADIIPYCLKHGLVLVTKDIKTATVDQQVAKLKAAGVSVWWLREERRQQMQRPQLLFALARDIDHVAFHVETNPNTAVHVVSSLSSRPRAIQIPYITRRGASPTLTTRPPVDRARPIRRTKRIPGMKQLFKDF